MAVSLLHQLVAMAEQVGNSPTECQLFSPHKDQRGFESGELTYISIEYVKVFKSRFVTKINDLYTYDTRQCRAFPIFRQMVHLSQKLQAGNV